MSAEVAGCIVCQKLHAKRTILEHSWYIPTVTFGVVHSRAFMLYVFLILVVGISLSFRISATLGT